MRAIAMLRHLPTLDDVSGVYTWADANPPLSPVDASTLSSLKSEIAHFLGGNDSVAVYTSDNPRGRETAKILLSKTTFSHVIFDARLNNILQPEWSGLHQDVVKSTRRYKEWHTTPGRVKFEHGESLSDVSNRCSGLLSDIGDKNVLIFSHTTPMQVLVCLEMGISPEKLWSLKFDHLKFSMTCGGVLLRLNSQTISDVHLDELRFPPVE